MAARTRSVPWVVAAVVWAPVEAEDWVPLEACLPLYMWAVVVAAVVAVQVNLLSGGGIVPTLSGGNGGNGGGSHSSVPVIGNGGGGGGGGSGIILSGGEFYLNLNTSLKGGNGGAGGTVNSALFGYHAGGGGGAGGHGVELIGTVDDLAHLEVSGSSTGGNGGNGGTHSGAERAGWGGGGGAGLVVVNGVAVNLSTGVLTGGNGGVSVEGRHGSGGAGVALNNGTLIHHGILSGGLSGDGVTRREAVYFEGEEGVVNRLEIHAGAEIHGGMASVGTATNIVALAGETAGSFNASHIGTLYQGVSLYEKRGSGTWTLSGSTTAAVPWSVLEGDLIASTSGVFGTGSVSIGNTGEMEAGRVIHQGGAVSNASFQLHDNGTLHNGGIIDGSDREELRFQEMVSFKSDGGTLLK